MEPCFLEDFVCKVDWGLGFNDGDRLAFECFLQELGPQAHSLKPGVNYEPRDIADFGVYESKITDRGPGLLEIVVRELITSPLLRKGHRVDNDCDGIREGVRVGRFANSLKDVIYRAEWFGSIVITSQEFIVLPGRGHNLQAVCNEVGYRSTLRRQEDAVHVVVSTIDIVPHEYLVSS